MEEYIFLKAITMHYINFIQKKYVLPKPIKLSNVYQNLTIIQYIPTPIKLCNIHIRTHQTNYNVYVQKLIKLFNKC
jgi:hypothetical protein